MNFLGNITHLKTHKTVITIGVFDGVHKGHQELISLLLQQQAPDVTPVVLTFSNHPTEILSPNKVVQLITNSKKKINLIQQYGIHQVIPIEFTKELADVSAFDFCDVIIEALNPVGFVIGKDFSVGKGRTGDVEFLRELGAERGFKVHAIDDVIINNEPVRSKLIRNELLEGNIPKANSLLGHMFQISGTVVHGNKRGRELGYPTANMNIDDRAITPSDGIYSTTTSFDGATYNSVTSIGTRPTFGLKQRLIETYIMDFKQDVYGQNLDIHFLDKIRGQVEFSTIEELIAQIESDVEESLRIIKQGV